MPCIAGLLVLIIALFLIVIVGVAIVTAISALGIGGASAIAVTKYKKRQIELATKQMRETLPPLKKAVPKEKIVTPSEKKSYQWMD